MRVRKIKKLMSILIHNVGDSRRCPHCATEFVPKDQTSKDAFKGYQTLNKVLKKKLMGRVE